MDPVDESGVAETLDERGLHVQYLDAERATDLLDDLVHRRLQKGADARGLLDEEYLRTALSGTQHERGEMGAEPAQSFLDDGQSAQLCLAVCIACDRARLRVALL